MYNEHLLKTLTAKDWATIEFREHTKKLQLVLRTFQFHRWYKNALSQSILAGL